VIGGAGTEYGVAMSEEFPGYDDTVAPDEEAPLDGVAPDEEAPLDAPSPDEEAPLVDPAEDDEPPAGSLAPPEPPHTGNHAVDEVLADVEGLGERPLDEHVEVYERAHEQLRGALDGAQDS
jgi:hypothetical protein